MIIGSHALFIDSTVVKNPSKTLYQTWIKTYFSHLTVSATDSRDPI